MHHVLITGGAGFVGSHLCELFLQRGYAVTAVDNLVTGARSNLAEAEGHPRFRFLEWDVCQPIPEERLPLLREFGLFGVLHLACPASPVDFDRIPFEILAVDSLGTMHAVDLALRYRARFLLASTSEIYGDPLEHPQREEYWGNVNTIGPRACYDETKRFAEAYVSTAARGKGLYKGKPFEPLDARIVRIFNTYGPRMRADDGRVVPELCVRAMRGQSLTVHGDGLQTRSFCFVSDLVEGIFRLFESDVREPVNLGNPVEFTVLEFARQVQKLVAEKTGRAAEIEHQEGRPDDPRQRRPDITRARKRLGWEPRVSLEEGLRRTLVHFEASARS